VIISTNAIFFSFLVFQLKTENIAAPRWRKRAGTQNIYFFRLV